MRSVFINLQLADVGSYHFSLSVQVRHPFADLSPIASSVSLSPEWIWRKGERKINRHGLAIGDVMSASYCTFKFPSDEGTDLNVAIGSALKIFQPAKDLLREIIESGGEVSVTIGWFSHGDSGDVIKPEAISAAASLGMSVHLHFYCEKEEDGASSE